MKRTKDLAIRWAVSRIQGSDPNDRFRLTLTDEVSGVEFLAVHFTAEEFAGGITGQYARGAAEVRGLDLVGAQREIKEEWIPERRASNGKIDHEAVRIFETDGWTYYGNYGNDHYAQVRDGVRGYLANYIRHVDPDTREPI